MIDEAASDDQAQKLGAVFGGELGGPMEGLAPLIGEMLGTERAPIDFDEQDGTHRVKAGDGIEIEVQDIVPFGSESGKPAQVTDVFHPAGTTLTVGKATTGRAEVFGLSFANDGKSGFSAPFSWAG